MTHWTEPLVKGDLEAAAFLQSVWEIVSLWDDLIDKDKPISDDRVNQAFWIALVVLPRNPFYFRNFNELQPLIRSSILNWLASNQLADDHPKLAQVLKSCYVDLVVACACAVGGREWAVEVAAQEWVDFYKES